jgi:hypothetical protein
MLSSCSLPLTERGVVDMIITEMCAFEVKKGHGLVLTEIAEGVTVEQVKAATQAPLTVSSQLKSMRGMRARGRTQDCLLEKNKNMNRNRRGISATISQSRRRRRCQLPEAAP